MPFLVGIGVGPGTANVFTVAVPIDYGTGLRYVAARYTAARFTARRFFGV